MIVGLVERQRLDLEGSDEGMVEGCDDGLALGCATEDCDVRQEEG